MKVSTRGEYGMRAMVELSRHYGEGPLSLTIVADASFIPVAYLEQIIRRLREQELVISKRGAHGGYELSRHPDDIIVGEIYRALEGPVAPMDCVSEETDEDMCPLIDGCATRFVWLKVRDSIVSTLDSIKLSDLLIANGETVTARPSFTADPEPVSAA